MTRHTARAPVETHRTLSDRWNPPGTYADEAPGCDGTCPTCVAVRDRLMSLDHAADVIAAADPENDPTHDYATQAEADLFLPDVIPLPCPECHGFGTVGGWPCACRMAGTKS